MAGVLTNDSVITCASGGSVTPASGAKLKVGGSSVLLSTDAPAWAVKGCPKNTPCATVAAPTAGISTRLAVGGVAVLLDSLAALGSSGDAVTAKAIQTKLVAS